jgi:hypothetical protein
MLSIAKNAFLAPFRPILDNVFLLNGKLLGYKTPNSMNYWVKYLENHNHLIDHFSLFRNHWIEHFTPFRLNEFERLTLSNNLLSQPFDLALRIRSS